MPAPESPPVAGRAEHDLNGDSRMADSLRDRIQMFILENYLFTKDASALGLDDSLLGRGIVDSTGMLEIIMFIEEQLGVTVKDEEMVPENLDSVSRIAAFVESKRKVA
jgi:acyl carrier protein